jgi:hypothetical protein
MPTSTKTRYNSDSVNVDHRPKEGTCITQSLLTNTLVSQGFLQSRLRAAFFKFYSRYKDLDCQYNRPLGQMLSDVFRTNRYVVTTIRTMYCLPDMEIEIMAGVTGRQGMVSTPPRHLIPPLVQ